MHQIKNMEINKINFLNREESKKQHTEIIKEYNDLLEKSGGKKKESILKDLAVKYGYSSCNAVRNMINLRKRK